MDKIVDLIKENQKNAAQGSPMVSQTTKNVVLNKLNPQDCNPQEVILDFMDELQSDILKVKINLSREYERQKMAWAKSAEGQKQDLDRLNQEFKEQNQEMLDTLGQLSNQDAQWSSEQMSAMDKLMSTLSKFDAGQTQSIASNVLPQPPPTLPQQSTSRRLFNIAERLDGESASGIFGDQVPQVETTPQSSSEDTEQDKSPSEKLTKEMEGAKKQLETLQKSQEREQKTTPEPPSDVGGSKIPVSPTQ